jgi:hypothetical protein
MQRGVQERTGASQYSTMHPMQRSVEPRLQNCLQSSFELLERWRRRSCRFVSNPELESFIIHGKASHESFENCTHRHSLLRACSQQVRAWEGHPSAAAGAAEDRQRCAAVTLPVAVGQARSTTKNIGDRCRAVHRDGRRGGAASAPKGPHTLSCPEELVWWTPAAIDTAAVLPRAIETTQSDSSDRTWQR